MIESSLGQLQRIGEEAGSRILEIYHRPFEVERKTDGSPVTLADRLANEFIVSELAALDRNIPVLTEESDAADYLERKEWSEFWLVDPLDGTRSFTSKKGQFTVNIAFIRDRKPVLGMVHAPLNGCTYLGNAQTKTAWKVVEKETQALHTRPKIDSQLQVLASMSHRTPADESFLSSLEGDFPSMKCVTDSSSLKFCVIAEGKADLYSRFQHTYEWDIGAAHAILNAAGGEIFQMDGTPFRYNKAELLNDSFLAVGDTSNSWVKYLMKLADSTLGN